MINYTSWLTGKYDLSCAKVDINSALSLLIIDFPNGEVYTFQGHEADVELDSILNIWCTQECSVEDAIERYLNITF